MTMLKSAGRCGTVICNSLISLRRGGCGPVRDGSAKTLILLRAGAGCIHPYNPYPPSRTIEGAGMGGKRRLAPCSRSLRLGVAGGWGSSSLAPLRGLNRSGGTRTKFPPGSLSGAYFSCASGTQAVRNSLSSQCFAELRGTQIDQVRSDEGAYCVLRSIGKCRRPHRVAQRTQ